MIDWLSFKIPCRHILDLSGGKIVNVSRTGEIEYTINKRLSVEGSHSSKITIRSQDFSRSLGEGRFLEISGNPVKFLQGHNVFGTDDLLNLVYAFLKELSFREDLGLRPTDKDRKLWMSGSYTISRVDINFMFQLENLHQVNAWLRAAEYNSRTRQGRPSMKGGTVYYHKNSRRWSMKFYAKAEEIQVKGRLSDELKRNEQLIAWTQNKLRAELTLRYNELDELGLVNAVNWKGKNLLDLHRNYLDKIEMSEQVVLPELIEQSLSPRLRMVYLAWRSGADLKSVHSKSAYYRYRKQLLQHGIDIAILQEKEASNVIPLVRVLEAQPVTEIPDFAKESSLYFDPPKVIGG